MDSKISLSETREEKIAEEYQERWQNVVNIMAEILDVPSAIITKVKPPYIEVFKAAKKEGNPYYNGETVKLANHYCESVIMNKQKLEVNNAPEDEKWYDAPEIKYGMIAYLGYPLFWPTGEIFGTICVLDSKVNQFGTLYDKILQEFKGVVETHLHLIDAIGKLQKKNTALQAALDEVKTLRKLLPICSYCKKIRNDKGYWEQVEVYIGENADVEFSHGLCPDCMEKLMKDK